MINFNIQKDLYFNIFNIEFKIQSKLNEIKKVFYQVFSILLIHQKQILFPLRMIKLLLNEAQFLSSRAKFQHAFKAINRFASAHNFPKLTYEQQLQLYGLQKQAVQGDNTSKKNLDNLKGKQQDKHEAWQKCRGKRQKQAQEQYVTLVRNLLRKYHAEQFIHDF